MGMIKIPENSIRFFKDNFDEIINSGNLAEGKWIENICKYSKEICGVKHATATASNGSGLMAVLHILKHYFQTFLSKIPILIISRPIIAFLQFFILFFSIMIFFA